MKRINLDQMKNMSIDNLIELYRDGYRLEEHTPITSLSNLPNFSNIHTLQEPLLDPVTNFGKVIVSSCTGGCTATATEVTVDDGTKFPDPTTRAFNLIWWNSTDYADPSDDPNKEIVRCTAKSGNVLTITRSQEGTSASTKNSGGKVYKMILSVTKKTISDISSTITDRVAKSGDTMTGDLIFSGAQKIIGGIGTTSDLTLQTTSGVGTTGADMHFLVGNNGATEAVTILNSGNVGIGTTNPLRTITGATGSPSIDISRNIAKAGSGNYQTTFIGSNDATNPLGVSTGFNASSTGTERYGWVDASEIGLVMRPLILQALSNGFVGIGSGATSPASKLSVAGSVSVGTNYTTIAAPSNGMIIEGNVGIGTTNPYNCKLDVIGDIGLWNYGAFGSGRSLKFGHDATYWAGITNTGDTNIDRQYLNFYSCSGSTPILAMTIKGGNVGIGMASPTGRLSVDNSAAISLPATSGTTQSATILKLGAPSNAFLYTGFYSTNNGVWFQNSNPGELSINYPLLLNPNGGNVGIGTTTPTAKLHIGGTSGVDGIKFPDGTLQTSAATSIPVGSYSPQINTTSTSYVKLLNFKFISAFTGNITMSWEMSRDTANQCYAKIYKNGVAIGTEKSLTATTTWEIKSDTVSVTMAVNDVLELWGYRVTNSTLSVRNILLGNVVLAYL